MANKNVKVAVLNAVVNTSTGNQTFSSTTLNGRIPKAAMFISDRAPTLGSVAISYTMGIGVCDGVNEWAVAIDSQTGQTIGVSSRKRLSDACILTLFFTTGPPVIESQATFVSFQENGVTINWTNAPNAANRITVILFAGDDLTADVGEFLAANTQDTSVDVDVGFEPDLVFAATHMAAATFGGSDALLSFGMAHNGATISQRCQAFHDADGADPMEMSNVLLTDRVIAQQVSGTLDWAGEITAFNPGPSAPPAGFTMTTRTGASGGADAIGYLALKIGDLKAWVGNMDTPTATGDDVNADLGFKPQFAMLGMTNLGSLDTVATSAAAGVIGISVFTETDEFSNAIASEDNQPTSDNQYLVDSKAVALRPDNGSTTQNFVATGPKGSGSFDDEGYTLNFSEVDTAIVRKWFGLAIEEPETRDVHIATVSAATLTATGNQTFSATELNGKIPKAAMFIITRATVAGTLAAHHNLGIGACDAATQWAVAVGGADAVATTTTGRNRQTDACVLTISHDDAFTIVGEASFVSFQADGVTINWGNAPDEADRITVILFAGDDLKVDVGEFNAADLVNTAIDVATGFEPDVLIMAGHSTASTTGATQAIITYGVAHNGASIQQRCLGWEDRTASVSGDPSNVIMNNRIVSQQNQGSITWDGEITAFNPGPSPAAGFEMTTRVAASGGADAVGYIALKIGNLQAWVGSLDTPTVTGDDVHSEPGFKPQFGMIGMTMLASENTPVAGPGSGPIGISVFTEDAESSTSVYSEDTADPTNLQQLQSDVAVDFKPDDGTTAADFIGTGPSGLGEFHTVGFTINYTEVDTGGVKKWFGLVIESFIAAAIPTTQPMLVIAN